MDKNYKTKQNKTAVADICPFHSTLENENNLENNLVQSRLTLNAIPEKFLTWLVYSRVRFLNNLSNRQPMRFFSAHLPTMVTWSIKERFPVNMTIKGIGLIPREKYIQDYTKLFDETAKEALSTGWKKSLSSRIAANKNLYSDINHFESSLLGGLEIFEGKAFENLKKNPFTSLLYIGMNHTSHGIEYISFQVNGEVEIIDVNNHYYKFLLSSRKLFEFDKFHLYQRNYPAGYLIKVKEVRDKSPFTRKDKIKETLR